MSTDTRRTISLGQRTKVTFPGGMEISGPALGYGKTITSVRGGGYIPGRFRYNPCTIMYGTKISSHESINGYYGPVSGHLAAHASQNHAGVVAGSSTWWYDRPMGTIPSFLADKARIRAKNKRLDSPFAGGLFLAELKQTIQMIRKPLSTCLNLIKNARKTMNKRRTVKKRRLAFESWWLEYRYGWTPAAKDVDDLTTMAINGIRKAQKSFFVTHGTEKYSTSSSQTLELYQDVRLKILFEIVTTFEARVRATCGWNYEVGYEEEETMASLGVGLPDTWGILYEKIPFSFVLDWFYGVGSYLSYLRPTPWLSQVGEGLSRSGQWTQSYIPIRARVSNRPCDDVPEVPFVVHQRWYNREYPTGPVMGPVLDTRFDSLKHAVDSLALIIQKGKR